MTPRDRAARFRLLRRAGLALAALVLLVVGGVAAIRATSDDDRAAADRTRSPGPRPTASASPTPATAIVTSAPATSSIGPGPATPLPARAGVTFGSALYGLSTRDLDRALADVVALHAGWIRIDLSWAGIQPVSSSKYDWSDVDAVVAAARKRNLQVLGLLTYTPPWARATGCVRFSCPPRRTADFATFAATAVGRYAAKGVRTYQVWNEPNITAFWNSPDPAAYGSLLRATTTAIRNAASGVQVLFGSLAFTGDDAGTRAAGNVAAAPFLRRACAAGCRVDAVGYDPYTYPRLPGDTGDPLNAWQRIANPAAGASALKSAMTSVGLRRATVWVTAFGAPTNGTGATDRRLVSEARQAEIVRDGARLAGSSRTVVGAYFVNTLRDSSSAGPLGGHFGLIRVDGTRKPAFAALTAALTQRSR